MPGRQGDHRTVPELHSGGEGLAAADLRRKRIAAIRETLEESGILLARPQGPKLLVEMRTRPPKSKPRDRAALTERNTTFQKVLADNKLSLQALDELVPYAHWITPEGMPKRFDTCSSLPLPRRRPRLGAHDGKESTDSIWLSPREALDGGESGRFKLPFPTTRNLIRLGKQAERQRRARGLRPAGPIVTVMPDHDPAQRRPPAPHPQAKPAMTANCSRSARWGDVRARRDKSPRRHCEEQSDEAIQDRLLGCILDCFASLAMTGRYFGT